MTAHETLEVRDLTAMELDHVSGAIWGIVGRIAVAAATRLLSNADHNGGRTITMGELLERNGL
jgi:hypothetical protein